MEQLTLQLKPRWSSDTVKDMSVYASFPATGFSQDLNQPALQYCDQAWGGIVPFPEWEDLSLTDDLGELPYWIDATESFYAAATFKGFFFSRQPVGTVRWSVTLLPRVLPENYVSSPYYDFRAEPYGLNGSGMFTFILPATGMDTLVDVHLSWDLSEMPPNARGIWSFGEGEVHKELTQWQILLTLYNTGVMHAVEQDGFGVYWFETPYFDAEAVAKRLLPIFHYERSYFHDEHSEFRVFLRRDPFLKSGGGSACPYAFISGYSAMGGMDEQRWFSTLLHEMTHTWPSMMDFNVGEGTWFTEGATEYYSTMLPYRGGFVDAAFVATCLQEKIVNRYLENPFREMSNMDLVAIQWQQRRAQTVPYGRGFLYIANVEAKLRRLGKGSIDEVVIGHNIMHPMAVSKWENFIRERLGDEGIQEFEDMKAGKLPELEKNLFGNEIVTVPCQWELDGKLVPSYRWEVRA